jgi:hypothetical protein
VTCHADTEFNSIVCLALRSGRVDAAVLPDWRTNSFVLPPLAKPAYFRYVRF